MALPQLSKEDREKALAKAAAARRARAEVKAELKKGGLDLPTVVEAAEDDEVLSKMKVIQLIRALPSYGPAKAAAVMADLDIAESRSIRGLGKNQREALLAKFAS